MGNSYELLKRCDRSMPDYEQRNLCQQTEMALWLKAKSLVRALLRGLSLRLDCYCWPPC